MGRKELEVKDRSRGSIIYFWGPAAPVNLSIGVERAWPGLGMGEGQKRLRLVPANSTSASLLTASSLPLRKDLLSNIDPPESMCLSS